MKKISRRLRITTSALVLLAVFTGILINIFTDNEEVKSFLKKYTGVKILLIVVVIAAILTIVLTVYQSYLEQKASETTGAIPNDEIEPDIKRLFDSLKERYQNRYQSKLDGRFEITLEVSDDFDSKPRSITEQFGENATKGAAIEFIREAFEKKGRLLIAGNPGVGKTVLLLKLAVDLLDKIEDLEKEPFPVIFNLASWSDKYENFGDWLNAMLVSGYGFSKSFAETVLRQERIIFLLDGLDELARNETKEIAAEKRAKCLASLNEYLSGERKAVICSRIEEFLLMKKQQKQDAPVSAKVRVLNLTKEQVLETLRRAGDDKEFKYHTAANNLLEILKKEENDKFPEVLSTPFYFTTAMQVFDRQLLSEKDLPETVDGIKKYLIDKFVGRKLKSEANPNNFESEKTKKRLKWLVKLMEGKQLITFELADLQPADLIRRWHYGLVFGLVGGLFVGLVGGLFAGLFVGLVVGSAFSLVSGLVFSLVGGFSNIRTEDIVKIEFSKKSLRSSLIVGLFVGLFVGLIVGLFADLIFGLFAGLFGGLVFSLVLGLENLKKINPITHLQSPYQRIYGGFSVNLLLTILLLAVNCFILISLIYFVPEQYVDDFKLKSVFPGLYPILLLPIFQLFITPLSLHLYLRFCFWFEGSMPLKFATFLDYAAGLRILEKDGGQWRFRHQNLQEYFAELD